MNNIYIKTPTEIELMKQSGKLLAQVFGMLDQFIKPGITTMDINDKAENFIVNILCARPASKGQYGYQYVLNTSINEVVCHGIPNRNSKIKNSDIINVDITLEKTVLLPTQVKCICSPQRHCQPKI